MNLCTQAGPCATFDRAYQAASPGDNVLVGTGSYPKQNIRPDASKTSATDVVFQPATGAQVHVARLVVNASHVEIRDMATAGWNISRGADHVTVRNVKSDGVVFVTGATNVLVQGGEVFSSTSVAGDSQIAAIGANIPTNVTFDGVWFHDFIDVGPGKFHHIECLQVGAGLNLTITNSSFGPNCDTHDLFVRSWGNTVNGGPHPLDLHITNNDFGVCLPGCYALMVNDDLYTLSQTHLQVAGNTFEPGTSWSFNWSHGTADFSNNVLPTTSAFVCGYRPPTTPAALAPSSFFHDNLFYGSGVGCGANARVVPGAGLPGGTPGGPPAHDTTPPTLVNMPGDALVEATGPGGASVYYTAPSATDNPNPNPTVGCLPASGSTFPLGSSTVTCIATDASGNTSTGTFSVTVRDTTVPTVPGSPTPSNVTRTSVELSWAASTDAVGVTGYDLWLNGTHASSTVRSRFTFAGLACGTAHILTVAAHDAAGHQSRQSSAYVSTLPCLSTTRVQPRRNDARLVGSVDDLRRPLAARRQSSGLGSQRKT